MASDLSSSLLTSGGAAGEKDEEKAVPPAGQARVGGGGRLAWLGALAAVASLSACAAMMSLPTKQASIQALSLAEGLAQVPLTTYCCGHATGPWRYIIQQQREYCDNMGWTHGFTFYAFSSPQPGASEYCVGTSHNYGPSRFRVSKGRYCGGDGWTHGFTFYAYDHRVSGVDEYCVGHATHPSRWRLSKAPSCGTNGWTHLFNLYMYTNPGNRVTLKRQVLRSINFPDLNGLPPIPPKFIAKKVYCNGASLEQTFASVTESLDVTTGTRSCFHWEVSTTGGFSVTQSAEISGGVPGIGEGKASASGTVHWDITAGAGNNNCVSKTETKRTEIKFPVVKLPPKTVESYSFTQYEGHLSGVKYTAVLDQVWSDGKITTTSISGTYEGLSFSRLAEGFTDEHAVVSCQMELAAENATVLSVDANATVISEMDLALKRAEEKGWAPEEDWQKSEEANLEYGKYFDLPLKTLAEQGIAPTG